MRKGKLDLREVYVERWFVEPETSASDKIHDAPELTD